MSEPFKFSAAAVPQTAVKVESTIPSCVIEAGTDAERIEAARALAIQSCHQSANSGYGMLAGFSPAYVNAYFREYAGNPSCWEARHICFLAQLIETRVKGELLPIGGGKSYDSVTGTFTSLGGFSFNEIFNAYHARIKKLGISEARLEEWNVEPRGWRESNAFYDLSFEERMQIFRTQELL